jgi:hypothetical protein
MHTDDRHECSRRIADKRGRGRRAGSSSVKVHLTPRGNSSIACAINRFHPLGELSSFSRARKILRYANRGDLLSLNRSSAEVKPLLAGSLLLARGRPSDFAREIRRLIEARIIGAWTSLFLAKNTIFCLAPPWIAVTLLCIPPLFKSAIRYLHRKFPRRKVLECHFTEKLLVYLAVMTVANADAVSYNGIAAEWKISECLSRRLCNVVRSFIIRNPRDRMRHGEQKSTLRGGHVQSKHLSRRAKGWDRA